jgi:hypothetical protein
MAGGIISATNYNKYLEFVISHLYIANPQARIGAIKDLTLSDYELLKAHGMISCQQFKTSETYTYQHVTACPATIDYMERYVNYFRPKTNQSQQYLFLTSLGNKMENLGRSVFVS